MDYLLFLIKESADIDLPMHVYQTQDLILGRQCICDWIIAKSYGKSTNVASTSLKTCLLFFSRTSRSILKTLSQTRRCQRINLA